MINGSKPIGSIHIVWLTGIGLSITLLIYSAFSSIRKRLIQPLFEYDMKMTYKGKEIGLKSLLDTGNSLYTPLGHRPVIVATYEALKGLFNDEQVSVLEHYKDNILELMEEREFTPSYLIPFNSVGCKNGILLGIEVDQISIHKNHFQKSVSKCIVALSFNTLFNDRSYHALLHPDFILNEGEQKWE